MKVGLFFGSFNPVHTGHMIIANHLAAWTDLDQVWLVVTPQNPFKQRQNLAADYDRLHMVHLAIGNNLHLRACDIEFRLPKPSYTVDTLAHLREKYPDHEFTLIMGGDNIRSFHKWKNHEVILAHHDILVYRRPGYVTDRFRDHPRVRFVEAPEMEISSSFIRRCIEEKKSIQYLVPESVREYLENNLLY